MTEAKDLLQNILTEVEAADTEMFKPNSPINPKNETVLCSCDDPLIRKIWAVAQFYRREAEHSRVDSKISGTDLKYDAGFNRPDDMADMLRILFWVLLRECYQLWASGGIGIRKEWKVVKLKDDDEYNCDSSHDPQGSARAIEIRAGSLPAGLRKLLEGLE